jgi:hypothetical protein
VLVDNPQLTVRDFILPQQPLRVVLDSRLVTPPDRRIFHGGNTLLVTSIADQARHQPYLQRGAELMVLPEDAGHANLPMLMQRLAERGVNELMIEAGAGLNGALVRAGLVDEAILFWPGPGGQYGAGAVCLAGAGRSGGQTAGEDSGCAHGGRRHPYQHDFCPALRVGRGQRRNRLAEA